MKSAIVILAPGFEEIEAVTPIDLLRRAGFAVTTAALGPGLAVTGGHGIVVQADCLVAACEQAADVVVVPGGGGGSKAIAASHAAGALITAHQQAGQLVAAICAAPVVVLEPLGLLKGKRFTCYPGMEGQGKSGQFSSGLVVADGRLITSRGAGTAGEFALAIIADLLGEAAAAKLRLETVYG
jgi:4-methyl-5(b-hydroxyethyl)-thiazole monophosphate biosynthesis